MNDANPVDLGTRIRCWSEQMNPRLIVPCGFSDVLMLGVIARAWMRWISTDPEFLWGGTIGIVVGFVSFSPIFSPPIFVAASAIMFPAVLAGAFSTGRTDWPRPIRGGIFVLGRT